MTRVPLLLKSISNIGVIFIAVLLFSACDGDNGDNCVRIQDDPDFLLDFMECPTDGLQMVCNRYDCVLSFPIDDPVPPPEQLVRINPRNCIVIDCFTMECETRNPFSGESIGDLTYSIENITAGSGFTGTADDTQDFVCSPNVD